MTALDHNDPELCAEIEAHPERFVVQIRMHHPEGTIEDGPLVNAAQWRQAFRENFIPPQDRPALAYFLIAGWLHSIFWGMSDDDRAFILGRIYAVIRSEPEAVRQSVRKLKLQGWSDFPDAYAAAPFVVKIFRQE
jgi:hypothetical protein